MVDKKHLNRAPIIEALIDIRVQAQERLSFSEVQQAFAASDFGYYVKGPISEGLFKLKLTADGKAPESTATESQTGLRLHSHDEKYVLQCRLSGFTLSRLPPYEDWPRFVEEAKRLWKIYVGRLLPQRVTRVATRFINNLQLPMETGQSFQQYIVKLVDVPSSLPQSVSAFVQRFHLADQERAANIVLTLALEADTPGPKVPVILDIDAFSTIDCEPSNSLLWERLDQLREAKNRAFFGTLTDKALELYE